MASLDPDEVFDAIALASQVLLELSLDELAMLSPEVNLSEYRVLVILDDLGPQRLIDLAAALEVTSTTATRLAERLVKHGMVERVRHSADRREVHLVIGEAGRQLVRSMETKRRRFISSVLADFPLADQSAALRVLARFGREPDQPEEADEAIETA